MLFFEINMIHDHLSFKKIVSLGFSLKMVLLKFILYSLKLNNQNLIHIY